MNGCLECEKKDYWVKEAERQIEVLCGFKQKHNIGDIDKTNFAKFLYTAGPENKYIESNIHLTRLYYGCFWIR